MAELEGEEEFATEVAASVERIGQEISDLEFARMMSGENDRNDAIVRSTLGWVVLNPRIGSRCCCGCI